MPTSSPASNKGNPSYFCKFTALALAYCNAPSGRLFLPYFLRGSSLVGSFAPKIPMDFYEDYVDRP